jgi:hypothetical protein
METQSRTYPDLVVTLGDQAKESHPEPGLTRRVLAYNDKLFLAEHHMVKAGLERCTAIRTIRLSTLCGDI